MHSYTLCHCTPDEQLSERTHIQQNLSTETVTQFKDTARIFFVIWINLFIYLLYILSIPWSISFPGLRGKKPEDQVVPCKHVMFLNSVMPVDDLEIDWIFQPRSEGFLLLRYTDFLSFSRFSLERSHGTRLWLFICWLRL